jgi:hypothetical protein
LFNESSWYSSKQTHEYPGWERLHVVRVGFVNEWPGLCFNISASLFLNLLFRIVSWWKALPSLSDCKKFWESFNREQLRYPIFVDRFAN